MLDPIKNLLFEELFKKQLYENDIEGKICDF